jgi:hypothetical protein
MELRVTRSLARREWSPLLTILGIEVVEGMVIEMPEQESIVKWSELVTIFDTEAEAHGLFT